MKLVYTALIIGATIGFLYTIFKDFKFSSISWRRGNNKLKREDEEAKLNK